MNTRGLPYFIILFFLMMAGCKSITSEWSGENISYYQNPNWCSYRISRVLVLPVIQENGMESIKRATEVWLEELQKRQDFEVVFCGDYEYKEYPHKEGAISRSELIRLGKSYLVQGIMVTTISSYTFLPAQSIGIKASLFSVWDGRVLWAVDGHFVSQESFHIFAQTPDDDLKFISPEIFLRSVYHRLLASLN